MPLGGDGRVGIAVIANDDLANRGRQAIELLVRQQTQPIGIAVVLELILARSGVFAQVIVQIVDIKALRSRLHVASNLVHGTVEAGHK